VVLAAVLCSPLPAQAEWTEWIAEGDARYASYDNINYSAYDSDRLSDRALVIAATGGRYHQLTGATRLRLTADVEAGKYDKYDKLDYTSLGATAAITHKLGLGTQAPWVRGQFSAAKLNVNSDMRDSTIYEAGIRTGKRFTPQFDGQAGLTYRSRDGKNGPVSNPAYATDVFDQQSVTLSLEGGYALTENAALTFGYSYRDGEFDSACTTANIAQAQAAEGSNMKTLASEDAYNVPMCVYKLEGKTHIYALNLSFALGRTTSLRLGLERHDVQGEALGYENTIARIAFVYAP
jgi:hypothetical protein